jgi:acetyl-CoA carboxylase biotin carboxyl carrier protein
MKYQDVLQIIKDFEASKLTFLELEIDDIKVKMSKECSGFHKESEPSHFQNTEKSPLTVKTDVESGYLVKSPLVGTFYASASPEASAFIRVGDIVKKGDTLCIIEAMKIMNEITAPITGKILSINAKSGDAIGFDQVLVTIEDAK